MPITYTNRKGTTFTLFQTTTKTGKPRYLFAKDSTSQPVEEIPEGWEISESVNGVVSLVKQRPQLIHPDEVAFVEAALRRHPKSDNYRVSVKGKQIVVHERVGPDMDDLMRIFQGLGSRMPDLRQRIEDELEHGSRFSPELRFVLIDEERRIFESERMSHRGPGDEWVAMFRTGPIAKLTRQIIPLLGTDQLYEIW